MLSDTISIRGDGFIHNRVNMMIFHSDKNSTEFLLSIKDIPFAEVQKEYPKVIELLWLN